MYRQDNDVAKGYLIKALNFLIEEKHITLQQGEKVLNNFNYECDCMTENEALEYYRNNFLKE
ncbi:hypothetical protein P5F43_15235 [Clostridium perfringens]|uniref:hypothetical protein n=1 Tax=Clostridium TaxID=1485 RepID=UPI0018E40297|nr:MULTISPECIES: hypothetical protein [Clostridium]ELC8368277.1 hypothetical protein [Clostridium perfringens]MBI6111830.1 hypothetical protein [Clostridium perfringens]MBI6114885.1 hypothetical protein [Clostridium perfringens]MDK0888335.1 hypothetical protein [Clostridium perfringens]WVM62239.1 hypothetical protein V1657_15995 [Clostridium perfringens]